MKKTIKLTVEQAKELYKTNPEFRNSVLSEFTDKELGIKKELLCWNELPSVKGYFVDFNSNIIQTGKIQTIIDNKNIFYKKKQASASLAMAQLTQLMGDLGDECEVNWGTWGKKYVIVGIDNYLSITNAINQRHFLAFKTLETCREFLEKHEELIKEYYMI